MFLSVSRCYKQSRANADVLAAASIAGAETYGCKHRRGTDVSTMWKCTCAHGRAKSAARHIEDLDRTFNERWQRRILRCILLHPRHAVQHAGEILLIVLRAPAQHLPASCRDLTRVVATPERGSQAALRSTRSRALLQERFNRP